MTEKKTVFVFPAFITDYRDYQGQEFPELVSSVNDLIEDASLFVDAELKKFTPLTCNFLEDELQNQYMSYIFGCATSACLKDRNIQPWAVSGLSMGLYAALKESNAISFRDGLKLIHQAFSEVRKIRLNEDFAMASLIGLSKSDILQLIDSLGGTSRITNCMAEFSYVLCGPKETLLQLLTKAKEEGALYVKMMNASAPYHTDFLEACKLSFKPFVRSLSIKSPVIPVYSVIDQTIVSNSEQVEQEIVRNLFLPLNWFQTQLKLQQTGDIKFIECGPSGSLVKNAKFIPGKVEFDSVFTGLRNSSG